MRPTPLLRAMREGTLSLGNYCQLASPEIMEVIGYCGFNHAIVEQMFSGIDWNLTSHMIRAAKLVGVTPIVRVQTNPWGSQGADFRLPAEVARAAGVGAGGAMASIGSVEELRRCLDVQNHHAHGRVWLSPDVEEIERGVYPEHHTDPDQKFFVVPLIELPELIAKVDEIVELDGLKAMALGIHDICQSVGQPYNVEHPEVWKLIDRMVAAAEPRGIKVWVNVGYRYRKVEDMVDRIERIWDHGVQVIQCQGPELLVQQILKQVRYGIEERLTTKAASK